MRNFLAGIRTDRAAGRAVLRWYRLARAYDYAGDRGRARETMKKAVELEARG